MIVHLALLAWAGAADVSAHRGDGAGVFAEATPPPSFADAPSWSTELPAWSNASPLVVGDLVCALSEPASIHCLDRATGALRWSDTARPDDALGLRELERNRREVAAWTEEARGLQATLARERAAGSLTADAAEQLGLTILRLWERVDRAAVGLRDTPPDREVVGYTSGAPVSDGTRIYALLGDGLVGAWTLDGTRVWLRAAPPSPPMRGYHIGQSAGPVLAGGLLLVPHGTLHALDPATGVPRWGGPVWQDYGAPASLEVDGLGVVATPSGEVVRLLDGTVVAEGLADVWFSGPVAHGQTVVWAGGQVLHGKGATDGFAQQVVAWDLRRNGRDVVSELRWRIELPSTEAVYTSPTIWQDAVWVSDSAGQLFRVALADGALQRIADVEVGPGYGAPVVAGGAVWLAGEAGRVLPVRPDGSLGEGLDLGILRSTPVFAGRQLCVRTLASLTCVGAP